MIADDDYFTRAQQALDKAKQKRTKYRGDCKDCKHIRNLALSTRCDHPAVKLVAFNLTNAYAKRHIQECGAQRDVRSPWGPVVCGPHGVLFERKLNTAPAPHSLQYLIGGLVALAILGTAIVALSG